MTLSKIIMHAATINAEEFQKIEIVIQICRRQLYIQTG